MSNKMILCADLHIQDGLYCQVGLDFLDYLQTYASDNDINKIVFLGDLLDKASRVHNEMFIPFFKKIDELKENGFEMWFILGNHDITSTLTNSSLLEVFEKYGHLVNSIQTYEIGNYTINMCPYTKDENLVPTVNADYLFTHLNISGFIMTGTRVSGEEQQAFPVSMFSNYRKVYTGHYHKRQEIGNIQYIGSPYQLNFGDAGDFNRGFDVFDADTGEEKFIRYTNAPCFRKYSYDELWKDLKENKISQNELQNNLIRIVVDRKVDELSKLKSILYNEYGVVDVSPEFVKPVDNDINTSADITVNTSIYSMLEDYVSKISIERDGFEIKGDELVTILSDLRGETV